MKLLPRFLCHYVTCEFPVRLTADDRISYRVTSWSTDQERAASHAHWLLKINTSDNIQMYSKHFIYLFLLPWIFTGSFFWFCPPRPVRLCVIRLNSPVFHATYCQQTFSMQPRFDMVVVWLMIWLSGQHMQVIWIQVRASAVCVLQLVGILAAVGEVEACLRKHLYFFSVI